MRVFFKIFNENDITSSWFKRISIENIVCKNLPTFGSALVKIIKSLA